MFWQTPKFVLYRYSLPKNKVEALHNLYRYFSNPYTRMFFSLEFPCLIFSISKLYSIHCNQTLYGNAIHRCTYFKCIFKVCKKISCNPVSKNKMLSRAFLCRLKTFEEKLLHQLYFITKTISPHLWGITCMRDWRCLTYFQKSASLAC